MQVDVKKSPDIFTSEGDLDISKLAGKTKDLVGAGSNSEGVRIRTAESESRHENRNRTGYDDVLTRNVEIFGTDGRDVIDMRIINYSGDAPEGRDDLSAGALDEINDNTKVRGLAGNDKTILHISESSSDHTPRHHVSAEVDGGAGNDVFVQAAPGQSGNIRLSGGKGTDTLVIKTAQKNAELVDLLGIIFVQGIAVEPDVERIKFTDQTVTYDELRTKIHGG